jgi:hypothetical protein
VKGGKRLGVKLKGKVSLTLLGSAHVKDLRAQLRALPSTMSASFTIGSWTRVIKPPVLPEGDSGPWQRTSLRVQPVTIGGTGPQPTARLVSTSETFPFVVQVSADDARKLGASLYREIDVELEMCRAADGRIESGRVTKVIPLADVDPVETWRAWFAENAGDWEKADDVGKELGRPLWLPSSRQSRP